MSYWERKDMKHIREKCYYIGGILIKDILDEATSSPDPENEVFTAPLFQY